MQTINEILKVFFEVVRYPLLKIGDTTITLWVILYFLFLLYLLFYLSGKFKKLLINRIFTRYIDDIGIRQSIATIVRYAILVIGLITILQTIGINLSTLTILAGALGVGIGFGLQNITNNFVSGVIILFERPVKVGDRIEVGGTIGDVVNIAPRATTIRTNDNISIIVPNSEFISSRVINWSYTTKKVRFKIPVTVSYGTDVRKVERLLIEIAQDSKHVLKDPPPGVRFMSFGDNGLQFELRAWNSDLLQKQGLFTSEMNFAIYEKFREHKIRIPFPQRDLHVKSFTKLRGRGEQEGHVEPESEE